MENRKVIYGPTYEEMLHPWKIDHELRNRALAMLTKDPLDPINLFNITWRNAENRIYHVVLPKELTGVEAPIAVLYAKDFPTGSHKVGATYSVLFEKQLTGEVDPSYHQLIWPSTGNYGIGGAWVGCRMNFDSIVILPELMSTERFDLVRYYGAHLELTPGCESNVKEIYDKSKEIKARNPDKVRILNQFSEFGNYRFHYFVTGNTIIELAGELAQRGIGNGRVAAYTSAMGSGGTIAAGDRMKQKWPDHKIIGLEPIQCPTVYWNGYGGHDIQGIGDKHVTWIHNVMNMDAMMCIDDIESKKGMQILTDEKAWPVLIDRYGIPAESVHELSKIVGISSICNILGAIRAAKYYGFGKDDLIVTVATDAIDRYHSVMTDLDRIYGEIDDVEAAVRLVSIFHNQKLDWIREGDRHNRNCWHNLKYYTWIEQQGKTVEELNAQRHQEYWEAQQARIGEVDKLMAESR
ncbi:pyridoxal-phosphate dependent enzyme [bacterium]|nr:pyridoxal-phosphate dependent enzyme [candidate division CSSED10-310 bacterium]